MLNLIEDAWIPVRCRNGRRRVIAPWQLAEPDILAPDWPRPDMNIACYELLIGLVYMADPPKDEDDWEERATANPEHLQKVLAPYAPAFNLLGDGPLFMQDFEPLVAKKLPIDSLLLDSATSPENNSDVMVHRNRYTSFSLPEAAMALYTIQDFAPAGGRGNRTSMRGGGPLVTLLDPGRTLWDMVWLNVPFGIGPAKMENLPWMKPTRTSEKGQIVAPSEKKGFDVEAFFGMPRRLRLVGDEKGITGVLQRPYGTNYSLWRHPLTPYYRLKRTDQEWLARHPRFSRFGYRNWLGVIAGDDSEGKDSAIFQRALILREKIHSKRGLDKDASRISVIVAGWDMNKMSPRDFVLSRQPVLTLSEEGWERLKQVIQAAEQVASLLGTALSSVLEAGEARNVEREEFFLQTEADFYRCYRHIAEGRDVGNNWLEIIRKQALGQFNALVRPGLAEQDIATVKAIVKAYKLLNLALWGHTPRGRDLFQTLGLPVPAKGKRKAA